MTEIPKNSRVTLQNVARAVGVHHTTVSLALRNSPKLRSETRLKIQQAARRLGYAPDPMLSALSIYRQSQRSARYQATLGWINNWPNREELLSVQSFREYYDGACEHARQLGYVIEEFWLHKKVLTPERLVRILKSRNIQGLLLAPQPKPEMNPLVKYNDFSMVAFGYTIQPPIIHVVTNHQFHSMDLMLRKLLELGYRRIGMHVSAEWDEKVENAWLGGLALAYKKYPDLVQIPPFGDEKCRHLDKWLAMYKPDVIVSRDAIKELIESMGYRIPEDLGFASLCVEDPKLSGLDQNNHYIGQKAVDVVVDLMHRGERGIPAVPIRLLIESTWTPGTTLRRQSNAEVKTVGFQVFVAG